MLLFSYDKCLLILLVLLGLLLFLLGLLCGFCCKLIRLLSGCPFVYKRKVYIIN